MNSAGDQADLGQVLKNELLSLGFRRFLGGVGSHGDFLSCSGACRLVLLQPPKHTARDFVRTGAIEILWDLLAAGQERNWLPERQTNRDHAARCFGLV